MRFEATAEGRTLLVEVRPAGGVYQVRLDGRPLAVEMRAGRAGFVSLDVDGLTFEVGVEPQGGGYTVHLPERTVRVELTEAGAATALTGRGAAGPLRVQAPMPGRIVRVLVEAGQEVAAGQGLVVMEAMKMENELRAPRAGRVAEVHARAAGAVDTGALLVVLE